MGKSAQLIKIWEYYVSENQLTMICEDQVE